MADPVVKREGNIRFVGRSLAGYPVDPFAIAKDVSQELEDHPLVPYGPVSLLFSLPPAAEPAERWSCTVGFTVTGLPRPISGLSIEDYRGLQALSVAHAGSIRDLPSTYLRLAERARVMTQRLRPYWRLALRMRRLADGNLLPVAEVAVFLDAP